MRCGLGDGIEQGRCGAYHLYPGLGRGPGGEAVPRLLLPRVAVPAGVGGSLGEDPT
jgi:hypothetical protein